MEKRKRKLGYGNCLLIQGAFLLLFYGVIYTRIHNKAKALEKVLEKVKLSARPMQVGLIISL